MTNPPPVANFTLYIPVNSTDETIREAGQWLLGRYQSRAAVPEVNVSLELATGTFWLHTAYISSRVCFRVCFFLCPF